MLATVIDGLRTARDEPTELPAPALDPATFSRALVDHDR